MVQDYSIWPGNRGIGPGEQWATDDFPIFFPVVIKIVKGIIIERLHTDNRRNHNKILCDAWRIISSVQICDLLRHDQLTSTSLAFWFRDTEDDCGQVVLDPFLDRSIGDPIFVVIVVAAIQQSHCFPAHVVHFLDAKPLPPSTKGAAVPIVLGTTVAAPVRHLHLYAISLVSKGGS
jgi:hypothetical protein